MSSEDKTEPATQKRRRKARAEGQVARSAELVSCLILMMALWALPTGIPGGMDQLAALCQGAAGAMADRSIGSEGLLEVARGGLMRGALLALPLMALIVVGALVSNVAQVGWTFTSKPFTPRLNRLDPLKGLQRLFTAKSAVELLKNALKVTIVGWVGWNFYNANLHRMVGLIQMDTHAVPTEIGTLAHAMAMKMVGTLTILAALDYAYQRWQNERALKMTKQEVKDEYKESEGNPEAKSAIRRRQKEVSRRRMIAAVPSATLVLTNPTHYSVALKYDLGQGGAPKVVAKGQGYVALRIREIARESKVPIVENPPLARALFSLAEVGQEIPAELYRAVAEVLAVIWKLDARRRAPALAPRPIAAPALF